MKYYYAIPVQRTVGKRASHRHVSFRFSGKTPQNLAENFMMDMGYDNHQYYFQTNDQYAAHKDCSFFVCNYVSIRVKNAARFHSFIRGGFHDQA